MYVLLAAQHLWTLYPSCPLDIIFWLTFQVPDQWNSINPADFSGTRSMKFHCSGRFFKCLINGIPLIWLLKFQNALHVFTLSMNWGEQHFWPMGHLNNGFQEKNTEKITFKKLFFPIWKLTLFEKSPICHNFTNKNVISMQNTYFDSHY